MAYVCAHTCPIAAPMWPHIWPCMRALLLQNVAHSCPHIWPIAALVYGLFLPTYMAYYSAHTWAITALVQIRYKAWRFNRFPNCPNLCTT